MIALGSALAPAAAPLSDPCEEAVRDWCKLRLADLHERHGIEALSLVATWYPHSGEIGVEWVLHSGGTCVVGQPSIKAGLSALRARLAERATTEAAQP